jgi:HEAT repeat protein
MNEKRNLQIFEVMSIVLFLFLNACGETPTAISSATAMPVPPIDTLTLIPSPTPTQVPMPSPSANPLLLLGLRSDDPAEKAMAAQQIAVTGLYPDGSIEALIECLGDSTRLIPSDKVPKVPPAQFSRDPNETSPGEQCEYALVQIGEPAVESLIAALGRYDEGRHRERIADSLGLIGDSRALAPLIDLLDKDSVGKVAVAVARLGGEQASDALLRAYNRVEDAATYMNLVYAMGYSKDDRFLPILLDLLAQEDQGVKLNAIIALGYLGNRDAVPSLVKLLQDEDLHARWYASEALGEIGDPAAIIPLQELLCREEEDVVRKVAADALGKINK